MTDTPAVCWNLVGDVRTSGAWELRTLSVGVLWNSWTIPSLLFVSSFISRAISRECFYGCLDTLPVAKVPKAPFARLMRLAGVLEFPSDLFGRSFHSHLKIPTQPLLGSILCSIELRMLRTLDHRRKCWRPTLSRYCDHFTIGHGAKTSQQTNRCFAYQPQAPESFATCATTIFFILLI